MPDIVDQDINIATQASDQANDQTSEQTFSTQGEHKVDMDEHKVDEMDENCDDSTAVDDSVSELSCGRAHTHNGAGVRVHRGCPGRG
jgi:hypothetical protein